MKTQAAVRSRPLSSIPCSRRPHGPTRRFAKKRIAGGLLGLLLAVAPGAALAGPVPLKADEGVKTPAHQQNVGKIVFSKSKIVAGKEKAGQFERAFKLTDSIYWRAYAARSAANAARAEGKECNPNGGVSDGVYVFYDLLVDGEKVGFNAGERLEGAAFEKRTTWSEDSSLTGKAAGSATTVGNSFAGVIEEDLKPGKHTIQLSAWVKCTRESFSTKPVATGELTLEVSANALATATAKAPVALPTPRKRDPKLEALAVAAANEYYKERQSSRRARKAVLIDDWTFERNEATGVVVSRTINTALVYREGEACRFYEVEFRQDAAGGGRFGSTYLANGTGLVGTEGLTGDTDIACSKVK